jgi:hypothetical protein
MWGVVPSISFAISVAFSQKNSILALWKWKTHFSLDKTKIGLHGVSLHPTGHARVRYDLVSANYAMIRTKSSWFNLKVMQPQTW